MKSLIKKICPGVLFFLLGLISFSLAAVSEETQSLVDAWRAADEEYQTKLEAYNAMVDAVEECIETAFLDYGMNPDDAEDWMIEKAWAGCVDKLGYTQTIIDAETQVFIAQVRAKEAEYAAAVSAMADCVEDRNHSDVDNDAMRECMAQAEFNWDVMRQEDMTAEDTLANYTEASWAMTGCMEEIGISDPDLDSQSFDPAVLKQSMRECMETQGFNWDEIAGQDATGGSDYLPENGPSGAAAAQTLDVSVRAPVTIRPACMIDTLLFSHD